MSGTTGLAFGVANELGAPVPSALLFSAANPQRACRSAPYLDEAFGVHARAP